MQEVWRKIETELANLAPDLLTRLHPGVAEEAFIQAESRLGFTLPEEVKAFFRLQNGSIGPFFGSWELLSLDEMCNDWMMMRARIPDPSTVLWEASWLALLRAGSHMRVYINIDAEAEVAPDIEEEFFYTIIHSAFADQLKKPGRVFISGLQNGIAANMNEFLEELLISLQMGHYAYDESTKKLRTIAYGYFFPPVNEPEYYDLIDEENENNKMEAQKRIALPGICCFSSIQNYADQAVTIMQRDIVQSWESIQSSIGLFAPEILHNLQTGATSNALQQFERQMDVRLPDDAKLWYSLCNGTVANSASNSGLFDLWEWYSLESIQWKCEMLQEEGNVSLPITARYLAPVDQRIQSIWWHPQWIPFMVHGDGSLLCLDMAPSEQGKVGQIILLIHKSFVYSSSMDRKRVPPVIWVAPDLRSFLAVLAQDFARGAYTFDDSTRMLWSKEGQAYVREEENLRYNFWDVRIDLLQKRDKARNRMQGIWQHLKAELVHYSPDLIAQLHPGVDTMALVEMERRLGYPILEEVQAFFLLQNGSDGPLWDAWEMLSLEEMYEECQSIKQARQTQSHVTLITTRGDAWFPLFRAASSLLILNQVSHSWNEPGFLLLYTKKGFNTFPEIADDLNQFLEELVRSLKMGCYVYEEKVKRLCAVKAGSPFPSVEDKPI